MPCGADAGGALALSLRACASRGASLSFGTELSQVRAASAGPGAPE